MTKPLVASHTLLDKFETCPRQAYHRYVAKTTPFVETEAMKWGTLVHEALERRVRDKTPLPNACLDYEPFAASLDRFPCHVEEKLGMTASGKGAGFFSDNVWARGKVDIAVAMCDTCLILDWKTGKRRENPAELDMFAMLIRANNSGIKKFKGRYVWLKDKSMGDEHELQPERKFESVRRAMEQMETLRQRGGEWPANPNGLCKEYCDVLSCAHNGRKA